MTDRRTPIYPDAGGEPWSREEGLVALRQEVGGIDPVLDNAADYASAVREVQKTVRQQGQVMSATLSNNHTLYHTNKKLVPENRALRDQVAQLTRALEQRDVRIAELESTLGTGGSDRYKALWTKAMKTLNAYNYDLLDHDQLAARLDEMKKQAAEIEAQPETATPLEIARGDYSDPYHPDAQAQVHQERMEEDRQRQNEAVRKTFGTD